MELISREAVINAIEKTKSARTDDNEVYVAKVNLLMKIDALSPIQPELGTNLAEVGTDCISRQAAIDLLKQMRKDGDMIPWEGKDVFARIRKLPPAQPEIIRCRNRKFASGDSRICMKFGHSPIGELDFCAWAERRTDE